MNRTFVMKAEELRIGNWVYDETRRSNVQIEDLSFDYVNGNFRPINIEETSPIPLTEQWLIDFGFENNDFGNFEKTAVVIWFSSYSNCYVFRFGHQNEIPVKSVHQLQNLYFALTGEDLHL